MGVLCAALIRRTRRRAGPLAAELSTRDDAAGHARDTHLDAIGRADFRADRATGHHRAHDAGSIARADTDSNTKQHAVTSNAAALAHANPDASTRVSVTRHVSAFAIADRGSAPIEDRRLERVIGVLRFVAAAAILLFGQALPNLGPLFVVVLGVFCGGYGLLVSLRWWRVRTAYDREQAARFTLAADISLVGFALFVFAPDPSWTIYASGFLVIVTGGFRFPNGALLAAASLSLTYVVVMVFRASALAIPTRCVSETTTRTSRSFKRTTTLETPFS